MNLLFSNPTSPIIPFLIGWPDLLRIHFLNLLCNLHQYLVRYLLILHFDVLPIDDIADSKMLNIEDKPETITMFIVGDDAEADNEE